MERLTTEDAALIAYRIMIFTKIVGGLKTQDMRDDKYHRSMFAMVVEQKLFANAPSIEAYIDPATITARVNEIMHTLSRNELIDISVHAVALKELDDDEKAGARDV